MPDFALEKECWSLGHAVVAGIDEAGRGPLAGPVMAAAVVLPRDFFHPGLRDSKKMTPRQRERVYRDLLGHPGVHVARARVEAPTIDRINVLRATWLAMVRAFGKLPVEADFALVDGRDLPDALPRPARAVIKGDDRSLSIAAASVVAKVERDRRMLRLAERYPAYGFERHKGYGTAFHLEALREHGPCPEHRRSFAPVAAACGGEGGEEEREQGAKNATGPAR